MELEMFGFITEVLNNLEGMKINLDIASREIENFFEEMLEHNNEGYLNINSRVKSKQSLKEKMLRYDYYTQYKTPEVMFDRLSDLIGIRLECRFIGDEATIYKLIRKCFTVSSKTYEGFYSPEGNKNLFLELGSKQPKSQKNGMKMYRIDGKYLFDDKCYNFEVQIKSLVNIFWSEIEHKVIYKNYNYIIADRFYKDIMSSIKNSLTTIDQQLLLISNQFDRGDSTNKSGRKVQMEQLLSKVLYDLFALKIKNSIGILIDFRKSCDTIVKYVFRDALCDDEKLYNETMVSVFSRLNEIEGKEVDFTTQIIFKRPCEAEDAFTYKLVNFIRETLNDEFQWNIFFRILFEIEPDCNAGDLEKFIQFYKNRFYSSINLRSLEKKISKEKSLWIMDELMEHFADLFIRVNTVELLYNNVIEQVISILNNVLDAVSRNIFTYEDWMSEKEIYMQLLELRLSSVLDIDVEATKVLDFLDDVRKSDSNIEIHKSIVKYIDKL
ncbi:MAG: hypothetical protein RR448_00095 [Niameybacter sp.]|uniref:GTP pyrophosphokinase n=1 Tax=Niameybacter sp. TaxID=2033640 RepID=UPI002FC7EA11